MSPGTVSRTDLQQPLAKSCHRIITSTSALSLAQHTPQLRHVHCVVGTPSAAVYVDLDLPRLLPHGSVR